MIPPATNRSDMVSWPGATELSLLQSDSGTGSRSSHQTIVVEADCNMAAAAVHPIGTRARTMEVPAAAGQHHTVVRRQARVSGPAP
jgi:hypothetical protein